MSEKRLSALEGGKASKEFVVGGFFVALILQFSGFLFIADIKVDPVREDIAAIKEAVKKLSEATNTNLAILTSVDQSIAAIKPQLVIDQEILSDLASTITESKFTIEDFTAIWAAQPADIKGNQEATIANFRTLFRGLSPERKLELFRQFEAEIED